MRLIKKIKVKKRIRPGRLKYFGEYYSIVRLEPKMIIKGYIVETVLGKISNVIVIGSHPNANPRNLKLCLPTHLRNFEFNKATQKMIENILFMYDFDDCYFTPWREIEYKKELKAGAGYGRK